MHGAEFLLGLCLIGLDYLPVLIGLAILLGAAAAWLLRSTKE